MSSTQTLTARALALALSILSSTAAAQPAGPPPQGASCQPVWMPTFDGLPGLDGIVHALAVYDDGSGPALYAGGEFTSAGGVVANYIARWDGVSWSALGSGMGGSPLPYVFALAVHDDGTGPALYAGGEFTTAGGVPASHVARWDGTTWSALGAGAIGEVNALAVFDDGSGPSLYAGGSFVLAGGAPANRVARWDGATWSALGSGVEDAPQFVVPRVTALAAFDDGSGAALYAGGNFATAGGAPAARIARWDGASWSPVGSGTDDQVDALAVHDDGSGVALYAGGFFQSAGGAPASHVARWDGAGWSDVGGGTLGQVNALASLDDGSGPALYAGGAFEQAGGAPANCVARWNGTSWSALGSGIDPVEYPWVNALAVYDAGGGPRLHAAGKFALASGAAADRIASWNGASWSALGVGLNDAVTALALHDDGSGPALYVGGWFSSAGGLTANGIARWDGSQWSTLGSGVQSPGSPRVDALAVFDDGSGPALYAGGAFTLAGGVAANFVARWDGAGWSPLGSGLNGFVTALAVHDDGSGPALYVGGAFSTAGGVPANRIAKWDGASWSALGSGASSLVRAFVTFDDGTGPALYAGGSFSTMGGVLVNRLARWDGASWSALGSGLGQAVHALAVFDDGGGPALYAGGDFTTAGGAPAKYVARWDGASWAPLGSGMSHSVHSLAVHDDGGGPALVAGGVFSTAGGIAATSIATWDGAGWSTLGSGIGSPYPDSVRVLATSIGLGVPGGPTLYAGGSFTTGPTAESYLAQWGCAIASVPGCAGNPARLTALAPSAPLGALLPLRVTGLAAASGLGLVVFGASGVDASGCGLVLPGLGELLLSPAPAPVLVAIGTLAAGTCSLGVPIPDDPSLRGVTVHLQGAAVDVALPSPFELTNGLAAVLGP